MQRAGPLQILTAGGQQSDPASAVIAFPYKTLLYKSPHNNPAPVCLVLPVELTEQAG